MEKEVQVTPDLDTITPHSRIKKILMIIAIGLVIALSVGTFLYVMTSSSKAAEDIRANLPIPTKIIPTPTPYPFRELTIPYLRERSYKSSIGEKTVAYQNANYIAYIASYDSDGLKINGLLTQPKGEMPAGGWPAIVFIHGYIPPTIYQTNGSAYYDYVDYLARNGFAVFKIDLRGHADSEGQASGAYFSEEYGIDTLNAYAALQNTDFINPKRIGLWGHSMAGNVCMRAFAAKPDIPAVVIWAGAVYSYADREKYGINDNSYRPLTNITQQQNRRQRLLDTHGEYDPNNIFWREFTPTNYLKDLKGAIQLNHAVNDDVVNIGYSRDLMKLLDETTVPHELYEYQSGGHNISGSSFGQAMQNTVEFYKKYLVE